MATLPKAELQPSITITKGAISPKEIPISNHGTVEFHVNGFENKTFCKLLIYEVKYTDDGITDVQSTGTIAGPGPVPLGTIKIGS